MAYPRIDSAPLDLTGARKLRPANQTRGAQVSVHAPEDPNFQNDQGDTSGERGWRRPIGPKQQFAKRDDRAGNWKPRAGKPRGVHSAWIAPPEADQRVHDEPVKRNRQLEKQNDRCNPGWKGHPRILIESAPTRQESLKASVRAGRENPSSADIMAGLLN